MQEISVICLGSNQGDRTYNLDRAREFIQSEIGNIQMLSSVYESEPWGYSDCVYYLNQVLSVNTDLSPQDLLERCLHIERTMGRIRKTYGYEPRIIDIDILFYSSKCIESSVLTVPHPRLHLRKFVLGPLMEILPEFIHPVLKKSIAELYSSCNDKGKVIKNPSTH